MAAGTSPGSTKLAPIHNNMHLAGAGPGAKFTMQAFIFWNSLFFYNDGGCELERVD